MVDRISLAELRERLTYEPETGVFRWKTVRSRRLKPGDRAGHRHNHGYRLITLKDRDYPEHHLAWLWMTGDWPSGIVDHKNLDRSDNRWENLRAASPSENMHNSVLRRNNTTGFRGVYRRGNGKFLAQLRHGDKIFRLGGFDTAEKASAAYEELSASLRGGRAYTDDDHARAVEERARRVAIESSYKPRIRLSPKDRLYQTFAVDAQTGCWNWTGPVFDKGYGIFKCRALGFRQMAASRASWIIHRGPIGPDDFVCHKCDNRLCINPDHLFIDSHQGNMADCARKGRINRGEDRPQAKLTEAAVREARRLRQSEGLGWDALAALYDVNRTCIRLAVLGRTWAHVDEPIPTRLGKPGRVAKSPKPPKKERRTPNHEELRALRQQGLTMQQVADKTGFSLTTVFMHTKDIDIGPAFAGARNPAAKLTDEDVRNIRRLRASGIARGALAEQYGVSPMTIHKIVKRESWASVE